MIGICICSIFTATLTTSLTSITLEEQKTLDRAKVGFAQVDNFILFTLIPQQLIQSEHEYEFVGENLRNINLVVVLILPAVLKFNAFYYRRE